MIRQVGNLKRISALRSDLRIDLNLLDTNEGESFPRGIIDKISTVNCDKLLWLEKSWSWVRVWFVLLRRRR